MQGLMRFLVFCTCLAIGLSALSLVILYDDLVAYYSYKASLKAAEANIDKLKILNDDYDALLEQLKNDPNLLKRIYRVTFGDESEDEQAVYPRPRPEELYAARAALAERIAQQETETNLPDWMERIKHPRVRIALFLSGTALIIISFIFFGPVRQKKESGEGQTDGEPAD